MPALVVAIADAPAASIAAADAASHAFANTSGARACSALSTFALDELDDQTCELAGDQSLIGIGAGVRIVRRLIFEVLYEQQVVRSVFVAVDAERQRSGLLYWTDRGELVDDRLGLGLAARLELDWEDLRQHRNPPW
jgi:hypothetical protein